MIGKQHPYCYPGTEILRSKEDIRDLDLLDAFERKQSISRAETMPRKLPITVSGFREIHRYMLQDVYDWAGQYRTVNTGRTGPFCKVDYIADEMEKRFALIRHEDSLRDLPPDQFALRAAEHINEINAIHPFLEGNGRTQRAFLEMLAEQAGHELDLALIEGDAWNAASATGFHRQDHAPMRDLIAAALVKS